jgi:ribonuclease D
MFCQFEYIDTNDGLDRLIVSLRGASRVALDTEADSLHAYPEKLCLLQLSHAGGHELVDPLGPARDQGPALARVREELEEPLAIENGVANVAGAMGTGVAWNESAVERYAA